MAMMMRESERKVSQEIVDIVAPEEMAAVCCGSEMALGSLLV